MATNGKDKEPHIGERMRSPFWLWVWSTAASVVIGAVLALVLPSRFTEEIGAQKIARLAAPFVGYRYSITYRDQITVLVIDRTSLEVRGQSWPASYDYYAWLLHLMNEHLPRGVFIDIVLAQKGDPEGLKRFENAVNMLTAIRSGHAKPRVFIAARRTADNELTANTELDRFTGVTRVGIEFSPNEIDRIAWTYPLLYQKTEDDKQPKNRLGIKSSLAVEQKTQPSDVSQRSAALAIYEDVYRPPTPKNERPPQSIAVTWGLDTAPNGLRWAEEPDEEAEARHHSLVHVDSSNPDDEMYCTSSEDNPTLMWRAEARSLLRSLSRPVCVFHRTVHASQLDEMSDDALDVAFKDRIVMIGASLRYSNDIVVSPLHDRIPGVFLHAMALDNLLTANGAYEDWRNWEPSFDPKDWMWWRFVGLALLGISAIACVRAVKDFLNRVTERDDPGSTESPASLGSAGWWAKKLADVVFNIAWFATTGLVLIALAVTLLVVGEAWLHVPFLATSHVIACTVAAEWFEWGSRFTNWILDVEET